MNEIKISLMRNAHWSVLSVSADILPLLGHAAADFTSGRLSLADLSHPDDSDLSEILFASDCRRSSGSMNLRLRLRQADGRIRCVRAGYDRAAVSNDEIRLELAQVEGLDSRLGLRQVAGP